MNKESLLTLEETLACTDGIHVLGNSQSFYFTSVQTDSRLVECGAFFIPLIGEFQDGHKYIPQAVEKGASAVFISRSNYEKDSSFFVEVHQKNPEVNFIAVENTMTALQKIAGRYVEKFPALIKIAVTGSSGKTTTKEILASILAQKYNVISNKGNLNSETGLPLSVFNIRSEHQVGLFEMGMNRVDEIKEISAVLKANYAIVTNIGTAHIGILGSRENIAKEKANVFNYFDGNGIGVIPSADDYADFLGKKVKGKVVLYGDDTQSVKFIEDLGLEGTKFSIDGIETVLSLPGRYNYKNALGAVALAQELGLSAQLIADGISSLKPMFGRSQVLKGRFTIVQDCYNANPDSMEKSLEFVSSVAVKDGKKKVFVLGDMLELGEKSKEEHEKVGEMAVSSDADEIIFIGTEMKYAFDKAKKSSDKKVMSFESKDDETMKKVAIEINSFATEGSTILIKGSRGIGLERLTELLSGGNK